MSDTHQEPFYMIKNIQCIEAFSHRTLLAQVYSLKVNITPFILLAQG